MAADETSVAEYHLPSKGEAITFADYLKKVLHFSSRQYKKIKYGGQIYINGQPTERAANVLLFPGDTVAWRLPYKKILGENLPLDIRYEDDYLLIVNKPPGQLVHPVVAERSGTLANAVGFYYEQRGIAAAFHPVQRLDRQTSGLVVIAKTPQIHRQLSAVGHDKFWREYLAVCEGVPSPSVGVINAPIARAPNSIIRREVNAAGKSAVTYYRVLGADGKFSLLSLRLGTGRTPQIRVHLAYLGHPLAGDDLYGGKRTMIDRQALHAARVVLPHPITGEQMEVTAEPPEDMRRFWGHITP